MLKAILSIYSRQPNLINNSCRKKRCPLFLAAACFHYKSDQQTFEYFLYTVDQQIRAEAKKLKKDFTDLSVDQIEIACVEKGDDPSPTITMDQEAALVGAVKKIWPNSNHAFCTRHLQDNLTRWLEKTAKVEPKRKNRVIHKLFGKNSGLVYSEDDGQYLQRRGAFELEFSDLCSYNYLEKFLDTLKENVLHPFWRNSNLMPSQKNNGE